MNDVVVRPSLSLIRGVQPNSMATTIGDWPGSPLAWRSAGTALIDAACPRSCRPSQQARNQFVMVVPPVVVADAGCADELGAEDHERLAQWFLGWRH